MLSSKNKEKIYIKCIESIKSTSESNKLKFISKLLFESFESWIFCGFYFQENDKLLVSEYCANKIPCSPINFDTEEVVDVSEDSTVEEEVKE